MPTTQICLCTNTILFRNFYKQGLTCQVMKKNIFIIFAITALLVQVIPVWWFTTLYSIWFFFIEALLEGGLFRGSLDIYRVFLTAFFSIYSVLALISPIWSLISMRKIGPETILSNRKLKILLMINITTIIFLLILIILNKGIVPNL